MKGRRPPKIYEPVKIPDLLPDVRGPERDVLKTVPIDGFSTGISGLDLKIPTGISTGPTGDGFKLKVFNFTDERYSFRITDTESSLKDALEGAGSIHDFLRTLWETVVSEIELGGLKRDPKELVLFAQKVIKGERPEIFSLGWFGDIFGNALLELMSFESFFPDVSAFSLRYIGESEVHNFSENLAKYSSSFFNLIRYTLPENMPLAEGYSALLWTAKELQKLDTEKADYPIEVIKVLKKSGLAFGDLIMRIELALVGRGEISDLTTDYYVKLDLFGLQKNIGKHLGQGGLNGFGGSGKIMVVSKNSEMPQDLKDALLLQIRIGTAGSAEELLKVLRETPIDAVIQHGVLGFGNSVLSLTKEIERVEAFIDSLKPELPEDDLLGIRTKLEELSGTIPSFAQKGHFDALSPKQKLEAIETLFFSDEGALRKYISDPADWDIVRQVASGQKLIIEVTRKDLLRGIVRTLIEEYINASKLANLEESAIAKKEGRTSFVRWPDEGKAAKWFAMGSTEEELKFALFLNYRNSPAVGSGRSKVDRRLFTVPSVVEKTIELAVKYAQAPGCVSNDTASLQRTFAGARRSIVLNLLNGHSLRHHRFWREATREDIEIVLGAALNGEQYFRMELEPAIRLFIHIGLKGYHREMGIKFDPKTDDAYVYMGNQGMVSGISDPFLIGLLHIHSLVPEFDLYDTIRVAIMQNFVAHPLNILPSVYNEERGGGDMIAIKNLSEAYIKLKYDRTKEENFFYHHGYFWSALINPYGITVYRYKDGKAKIFWSVEPSTAKGEELADIREAIAGDLSGPYNELGKKIGVTITAQEVTFQSLFSFLLDPINRNKSIYFLAP